MVSYTVVYYVEKGCISTSLCGVPLYLSFLFLFLFLALECRFKRLTGRSEVAVSPRDYKFYSPRHKYRRVASNSMSNIPGLPVSLICLHLSIY